MNHSSAQKIFEEIRSRPYEWSSVPGKSANNCYYKGIELLQRLGILGYAVRGRVGETYLDSNFPVEIRALYPQDLVLTHFWVEVELDDGWSILDASYDPPLAKAGFVVNSWESNTTCFEITKTYSQEQAIAYQNEWNNPNYARDYFQRIGPCAKALNSWFADLRKEP